MVLGELLGMAWAEGIQSFLARSGVFLALEIGGQDPNFCLGAAALGLCDAAERVWARRAS